MCPREQKSRVAELGFLWSSSSDPSALEQTMVLVEFTVGHVIFLPNYLSLGTNKISACWVFIFFNLSMTYTKNSVSSVLCKIFPVHNY